jgi:hypothetical protein
MALLGAADRVSAGHGPRFLVKNGVSIELRLGLRVRATKDVDLVFRGTAGEMLEALEQAFEQPYAGFAFRRKGEVEDIRDIDQAAERVRALIARIDASRPESRT